MRIAKVVGNVVATVKDPSLTGKRILLIREIGSDGQMKGEAFAALDVAGVGAGETVFFVSAREAAFPFEPEEVPVDTCILGVVDRINRSSEG
ncbi:MAG: EutN/CcmL family microcompartment protein [Acidobacteria bacterium]|nr:EutN/CcmL family microcompartment protein [Acidobacteriota bacterium]